MGVMKINNIYEEALLIFHNLFKEGKSDEGVL